jgi:hypothetical protein
MEKYHVREGDLEIHQGKFQKYHLPQFPQIYSGKQIIYCKENIPTNNQWVLQVPL